MGRFVCAIGLVLGSGCAQLFGLDDTTGKTHPDAPPGSVTAQLQRFTVGTTVSRTPLDLSAATANYFVPDDTDPSGMRRVPATLLANDTWVAAIPDGNPPIEFLLGIDYPYQYRRLYALPQRAIQVLYGYYEDIGAVPAPPGGGFQVHVTLPSPYMPATESFQIQMVGAWATHGMTAAELPAMAGTSIVATIPYDATTFSSVSGRPLVRVTQADEVLAVRYVGNQLTGVAEFPAFDQSGATDIMTATMVNVPLAPLDVHIDPMGASTRIAAATPSNPTAAMAWSVRAAPGWEVANGTGPTLHSIGVLPTDSGAINAMYGNPFIGHGWRSVFTWAANKYRTYNVPTAGNFPLNLYAGINDVDEVAPGLTLTNPAPLPILVTLNGAALNADGKAVTLQSGKAVTLGLTADGTDALYYQFNVYEIVANAANTAVEQHVAYVAINTDPMATLPSDVFVSGKTYQVRAHCIKGGYPGFGEGNLWDRNLPYSVGFLDAGIFTVTVQ